MNFLAHFHLARPTDASRVGALLGDFVRGPAEVLLEQWPTDLVEGIMLHRRIDQFTDSHPVFRRCKSFLHPSRRRFSGIVIDLFFDHLLSRKWAQFSELALPDFITLIHDAFDRRQAWLPPEVAPVVGRMKSQNWLATYQSLPGLALTLQRVSQRRPFLAIIDGAEDDLTRHHDAFEEAFDEFYPALVTFARQAGEEGAFNSP